MAPSGAIRPGRSKDLDSSVLILPLTSARMNLWDSSEPTTARRPYEPTRQVSSRSSKTHSLCRPVRHSLAPVRPVCVRPSVMREGSKSSIPHFSQWQCTIGNCSRMHPYVMIDLLSEMITEFANECEKHNVPKLFRWHADGDIFTATYAEAIEAVCLEFPDVHFWIYTRSFEYVGFITSIPNLSVYLSVDKENLNAGLLCAADNPGVKMAYLGETFNEGKEIFETLTGVPGGKCPENAKQIPLITEKGGACVTCGLCIFGKADIRFSRTKK